MWIRGAHWTSVWKVNVAQSCLTLCHPMDYKVHGILQARILEWVATASLPAESLGKTSVWRVPANLELFCCSVVSDSLRPHELQHARLPCPSPSPGVCSESCPLSWWCYPIISSSVTRFSSCPQSFPPSGSFQMCRLFASGGQSIGASASASVLPMNILDWFPLGLTGLSSLKSKGLWRVFSNTTVQKHQFFDAQPNLE